MRHLAIISKRSRTFSNQDALSSGNDRSVSYGYWHATMLYVEQTHTSILIHVVRRTDAYKHFDSYESIFCSNSQELRSCQFSSFFDELIFRLGPVGRSRDNISSYEVDIMLAYIIRIQRKRTCLCVTLHHSMLHRFQSTMCVFRYFDFWVFFRTHNIHTLCQTCIYSPKDCWDSELELRLLGIPSISSFR